MSAYVCACVCSHGMCVWLCMHVFMGGQMYKSGHVSNGCAYGCTHECVST